MKDVERIELLRGDTVVSSLAAAFGRGLRETRLTAMLEHRPTRSERCRGCLYLHWRDLLPVIDRLSKSQHAEARFVSRDLRRYLEEHRMIPKSNPVEIYAREINEERTLALFLHGQIYHCYHEPGSRLAEALYFAPHFGNRISSSHPGIQTGISYIARIERVEVIETFAEFAAAAREICGAHWLRKNANDAIRSATVSKTASDGAFFS